MRTYRHRYEFLKKWDRVRTDRHRYEFLKKWDRVRTDIFLHSTKELLSVQANLPVFCGRRRMLYGRVFYVSVSGYLVSNKLKHS